MGFKCRDWFRRLALQFIRLSIAVAWGGGDVSPEDRRHIWKTLGVAVSRSLERYVQTDGRQQTHTSRRQHILLGARRHIPDGETCRREDVWASRHFLKTGPAKTRGVVNTHGGSYEVQAC